MVNVADNDQVNGIEDFKDKVIGAGGITMMGGGQVRFTALFCQDAEKVLVLMSDDFSLMWSKLQFYEMVTQGLSFVADPKQVIFTDDEYKTVQGVLDGHFDIGFARTGQIEQHRDANNGKLL